MGDRDIYNNQSESESEADAKIPVDYFVTKDNINKKNKGLDAKRQLRFVDSSGNLVYTVNKTWSSASPGSVKTRLLLDASGNLLISLRRINVRCPFFLVIYARLFSISCSSYNHKFRQIED